MRKHYKDGNYEKWINIENLDEYVNSCLNLTFYKWEIQKEIKKSLDTELIPDLISIECLYSAIDNVNHTLWNELRLDVVYKNNEEKRTYENILQNSLKKLKEFAIEYLVFDGLGIYSAAEQEKRIKKMCDEILNGIENMNSRQKRMLAWDLAYKNKTAPTLQYGYVILAILLFAEGFFFLRIWLWILTISLFIWWKRNQIDKFNR